MKKAKRIFSLLLSCALLAGALTMPAGAAATATFSDVSDSTTAASIETLRLLGVLDGYSNGTFQPESPLTRAQFCKMAVYALNAGSELGKYRATTIFPDVKTSYWAAAYVNLAAKGKTIIAGYPDGYFRPGRTVTYGQAVTILMRMLGYTDADMGTVWPDGYLAQADTIGLTEGVRLTGSAALSRGNAARLFANLLRMNKKDNSSYASSISASQLSNVVLLSCTATATDGSTGAMQTSDGAVYKMANKQGSGILNGRKGTLLLDKNGKVLTFVPDAGGSSATVVLATAGADSLTDNNGRKYTIGSSVQVFYEGKTQSYGSVYSLLSPGMTLTIYFGSAGSVEYISAGGSTATNAVIVYAKGSTAGFSELAGGTNYSIVKDGVKASASDLRAYDVATYDSAAGVIRVSSTRLTGYYESCEPNSNAPTSVHLLGHDFTCLTSATETLSKLKLGSQITLLLTADNQVAGAVTASGTTATGNAVGLVTKLADSSATVQLLCGITVTGDPGFSASQTGSLTGQLVSVSSYKKGGLSLSRVSGTSSSNLDVAGRKLGSTALADNVVVYEKVNTSALKLISLANITDATVSAGKITYVGKNWAGQANILILNDVTGSCYTYGRATVTSGTSWTDDDGNVTTDDASPTVSVTYGNNQTLGPIETGYVCANGSFVGMALSADGSSVAALVTLEKLSGVSASAWSGTNLVTTGGKTYTVSSDVVCYNRDSNGWMTLAAARAYASTANLYVDSHNVVRVVEVFK